VNRPDGYSGFSWEVMILQNRTAGCHRWLRLRARHLGTVVPAMKTMTVKTDGINNPYKKPCAKPYRGELFKKIQNS